MRPSCMSLQEAANVTAHWGDYITNIRTYCNVVSVGHILWPNFLTIRLLLLLFSPLGMPLPVISMQLAHAWSSDLYLNVTSLERPNHTIYFKWHNVSPQHLTSCCVCDLLACLQIRLYSHSRMVPHGQSPDPFLVTGIWPIPPPATGTALAFRYLLKSMIISGLFSLILSPGRGHSRLLAPVPFLCLQTFT